MRACSYFFANFAVAEPFGVEVCGFGCQEPSSVSFVKSGHIRQINWREDFWRSFLSHLKEIGITFKDKKISLSLLYYIDDNQ